MTRKLLRSGALFDLVSPDAGLIDIERDIAIPLALIHRFDGQLGPGEHQGYSVGQHSILGARALWEETGRADVALAFLLHDATHEPFTGDLTTPVVKALDALAAERAYPEGMVGRLVDELKSRSDIAIYKRLGLSFPWPEDVAAAVADMDRRMLRREFEVLAGLKGEALLAVSGVTTAGAGEIPALVGMDFQAWGVKYTVGYFHYWLNFWLPQVRGGEGPHPSPLPEGEGAPAPETSAAEGPR
jgi:hypothetical protein